MSDDIKLDLDGDTASVKKPKATKLTIASGIKAAIDEMPLPDVLSAREEVDLLAPTMQELGIRADLTTTELFNLGIEFHNGAMVLAVKAGVAFIAAKNSLSDVSAEETFLEWIEANGLTHQRVYEAIKLAKAYMTIPADQRKSFIQLGKFKAIKLAKLDAEQINELIEQNPEALDGFALMSRDELKKRIKNLEANFSKLRDEKEILERERKRTHKPGDLAYDPRTFEVRHEVAALEYAARMHVDALEVMFNDVVTEPADSEQEQDLRIAALSAAAGALLHRANALYSRMSDVLADLMPMQAAGQYLLTNDEIDALQDSVTIINASYSRKKEDRIAERNADAPPRRGRPSGSKNKMSEG